MNAYIPTLGNPILIETIYMLIVLIACIIIYVRTRELAELSNYKGIHYFRTAFLFFAIAFAIRYIMMLLAITELTTGPYIGLLLSVLLYYMLSMAGFYLLYSLVWKHAKEMLSMHSDVFFIVALHIIGLAIGIATTIFQEETIMFVPQIIILGFGALLSYFNYQKGKNLHNFLQLYFMTMLMAFIGFTANFVARFIIPIFPLFRILVYAITISVFVLFLYGVLKVTKQAW
jgi:hypothetical protein